MLADTRCGLSQSIIQQNEAHSNTVMSRDIYTFCLGS